MIETIQNLVGSGLGMITWMLILAIVANLVGFWWDGRRMAKADKAWRAECRRIRNRNRN